MAEDTGIRCPTCGDEEFEVLTTTGLNERVMCCGCEGTFRIRDLMSAQARQIEMEVHRDRTEKAFRKLTSK